MNTKVSKEQIEHAISCGHKTATHIAKFLNLRPQYVSEQSKKMGVALTRGKRLRRLNIDENYFEKIDTPEKSYWLGFLYADGCIYSKSYVHLGLAAGDLYMIEKFRAAIKSEHKIGTIKALRPEHQDTKKLAFSCPKMYDDLTKCGIHERKSLDCGFPGLDIVPEDFLWHFIRGYMDGDGTVYSGSSRESSNCRISFCVSLPFGEALTSIISESIGIYSRLFKSKSKIHTVQIAGRLQCIKLLERIYENSEGLRLDRKYSKYLDILSMPSKKRSFDYKFNYCGISVNQYGRFVASYYSRRMDGLKNRITKYIGTFKTEEDAVVGYDDFCSKNNLPNYNLPEMKKIIMKSQKGTNKKPTA